MRNKFLFIAWSIFILAFLGLILFMPQKIDYLKEETLSFNGENSKFQISTLNLTTTQKDDIHIDLITTLDQGRVDFELYDPRGFLKFAGYIEKADNKLYKKLHYPEDLNKLNDEVSTTENSISEFLPISYFKSDGSKGLIAGTYTLKVQPLKNTKGYIAVKWSKQIDKKKFKEFKEKTGSKIYLSN